MRTIKLFNTVGIKIHEQDLELPPDTRCILWCGRVFLRGSWTNPGDNDCYGEVQTFNLLPYRTDFAGSTL